MPGAGRREERVDGGGVNSALKTEWADCGSQVEELPGLHVECDLE